MEDLIGGHVPASVNPVSEVMAFAKAGKIRALAVTGEHRTPFLPDVPTMKEQGFNVVVELLTGVFVPARRWCRSSPHSTPPCARPRLPNK